MLDRHDLVDDVANFLARAFLIELGQRGEIDRLDQRAEDHRFGLEIAFRPLFPQSVEATASEMAERLGRRAECRRRRRRRRRG